MSRFEIEKLIAKAKELRLSRLRVAESGEELTIELRRAAPVAPAIADTPAVVRSDRDVTSAFVGYFRPAVQPGETVAKDTVVGMVESLGLPNDIVAPAAGTLMGFEVEEGDAVEYGTVVARIQT